MRWRRLCFGVLVGSLQSSRGPALNHVEERLSMAVRSVATSVPVIDRERHAGGVSSRLTDAHRPYSAVGRQVL
jgi:hypothetical protein